MVYYDIINNNKAKGKSNDARGIKTTKKLSVENVIEY